MLISTTAAVLIYLPLPCPSLCFFAILLILFNYYNTYSFRVPVSLWSVIYANRCYYYCYRCRCGHRPLMPYTLGGLFARERDLKSPPKQSTRHIYAAKSCQKFSLSRGFSVYHDLVFSFIIIILTHLHFSLKNGSIESCLESLHCVYVI